MTIKGLYRKVEQIDNDKIIGNAFENTVDDLGLINKDQLLAGKNNKGQDITPSYFDDPYFKSKEAAQRYSNWKDKITPNPKRNPGTPNLFINGRYHNSRKVVMSGDRILYDASYLGKEINQKYSGQIDGLGGEFKKEFIKNSLRPALNKEITAATGLKFGK